MEGSEYTTLITRSDSSEGPLSDFLGCGYPIDSDGRIDSRFIYYAGIRTILNGSIIIFGIFVSVTDVGSPYRLSKASLGLGVTSIIVSSLNMLSSAGICYYCEPRNRSIEKYNLLIATAYTVGSIVFFTWHFATVA